MNVKDSPWLRVVLVSLAVGSVVYGLLWGVTAVWGIRGLRAQYDAIQEAPSPDITTPRLIRVDRFDPEKFRHPKKDEDLFYVGRFRTPAPFLVVADVAGATVECGHCSRVMWVWWMGDFKLIHQQTLWSFGDYSDPDF